MKYLIPLMFALCLRPLSSCSMYNHRNNLYNKDDDNTRPIVYFNIDARVPIYDRPGGRTIDSLYIIDNEQISRWYELIILEFHDTFAYVKYNEYTDQEEDKLSEKLGWMRKDLLTINLQYAKDEPELNIPLYEEPDIKSRIKIMLHNTSLQCEILRFYKDWLYVRILSSGEEGWLSKNNYNAWPW